jgi:actin related protein 2/3 complex subunit 2
MHLFSPLGSASHPQQCPAGLYFATRVALARDGAACALCPRPVCPHSTAVAMVMVTVHSKKRDYIDVSWITDFDGTVYKLSSGSPEEPENKSLLCMSIQVVGYDEIVSSLGGAEFLQDTCYAKYLRDVEAGDGTRKFNVTVLANVDELPEEQWESFAYDWACMKRNLLGFPLARALEGLVDESKALTTDVVINYRPEESIYVCPDQGKVTVVYALSFPDPNDMEIAKVFLEEFTVAKRQRELGSSPSVNFGPTPPGELSGFHLEPSDAIVGFLSLSKSTASLLLPAAHVWPPHQRATGPPVRPDNLPPAEPFVRACPPPAAFEKLHVRNPEMLSKAVDMLFSFRSYLHYHIKCCKGYMHTRMRIRVDELLKVLHRADPTKAEKKAAGRSWGK